MDLKNIFTNLNTAVITGASSGIGKAAAIKCAKAGMHVWMLDIDTKDLSQALQLVKSSSSENASQHIQEIVVDVSQEDQMNSAAQTVFAHESTQSVHFLMNNAAVQLGGGPFEPMDTFRRVLDVNTLGPIIGCQAFVPTMQEKGMDGLIVNTGSKQGITAPPGNLSYNVSKAALKTWTEGLEHELMKRRLDSNSGGKLYAALLIPGWVNTSIALKEGRMRAEREGKLDEFDEKQVFFHENKPAQGAWMPGQVIDFMLEELEKGRFYIVCPDNDVDRETDNLRMTWAMQDITKNRDPLSRWHPDWKDAFSEYLKKNKK
jgi:NAD(P)-dependent dehydrogenase (short-subunit alcohol dehydrogenase family)